jgi:hypothetical protein
MRQGQQLLILETTLKSRRLSYISYAANGAIETTAAEVQKVVNGGRVYDRQKIPSIAHAQA